LAGDITKYFGAKFLKYKNDDIWLSDNDLFGIWFDRFN